MSTLPRLRPVVELPWFEGTPPWPWPIADAAPFSFLVLSAQMKDEDVGSVVAQLVKYNHIEIGPTVEELLARVVAAESLLLPGGVQASEGDRRINPGCCSGLEECLRWFACPETKQTPWLGHDPSPYVEWSGDAVRVWSDGGIGRVADAFAIEFTRERFADEVARVGRDLRKFLARLARWARVRGFSSPKVLCDRVAECWGAAQGSER